MAGTLARHVLLAGWPAGWLAGCSMPLGQTRTVYVADYFHSGNPADH